MTTFKKARDMPPEKKENWRTDSRWGGENSAFWRGNVKFRAFNEGGRHVSLNLRLLGGWLPIGFYFAVTCFGRFFRLRPGWKL